MTVELDLSVCSWKFEGQDICGFPATGVIRLRLPHEMEPGVVIAEDQRNIRMGICDSHSALLAKVDPTAQYWAPEVSPMDFGDIGELVPMEHVLHSRPVTGCLGCDLTFGPAHTRT